MNRVIIFDWDGTLVDARPRSLGVFQQVLSRQGIHADAQVASLLFEGTVASALDRFGITGRAARVSLDDYCASYLASSATQVQFFAGVRHSLRYWRRHGVRLAIVTSKMVELVRADDPDDELLSMVDVVVGDGMCAPKPSADGVSLALEKVGGSAQSSVMLGDSACDVTAARAAGCLVVGAAYGFFAEELKAVRPDRVADSPHLAFRHVSSLLGLSV